MSEKIPYEQVMGRMRMDIDYIAEEAYQKGYNEGYQKGFEAGQHEATTLEYQQGLCDAWEAAKKIFGYEIDGGLPVDELRNAFGWESGLFCTADILRTNTASEAIAKLKAYEEQQKADAEIKVGDEVVALSGKAIVFRRFTDAKGEDVCVYWYPDENRINRDRTSTLEKTGRHFPQVEELLEAMKDGEVTE